MNNCSDAGVLGATAGIAGSLTASLVIKYFIDPNSVPIQNIILFDSDNYKMEHFPVTKRTGCSACHHKKISWPTESFSLHIQQIDFSNYKIIDVREPDERKNKLTDYEHNIPLNEIFELTHRIPSGKLLLYCQSGVRSDYAAYFLRKNGFTAFSLEGGIDMVCSM